MGHPKRVSILVNHNTVKMTHKHLCIEDSVIEIILIKLCHECDSCSSDPLTSRSITFFYIVFSNLLPQPSECLLLVTLTACQYTTSEFYKIHFSIFYFKYYTNLILYFISEIHFVTEIILNPGINTFSILMYGIISKHSC